MTPQRERWEKPPMDEAHFRMLERMYHAAPCNVYYKPTLRIEKGKSELHIPITPNLWHAARAAHGSVYFKAVDDAAYFAALSLVPDVFILTTSLNVYLTRPITEGTIIGKGRVTFASKNLFNAETILTDADGNEIGRGTASFARSKMPLESGIGYG
jgi:acyl-coenzyme A thioesterase PaaI-like protein